jgi:hypothetical protein
MLQGVARHSPSGVMRAHWKHEDYLAMQRGDLWFDTFDVKLIHDGLTGRASRLALRAVAAISATAAQ